MQQESEQLKSKYNLTGIFNELNLEIFNVVRDATKSTLENSQGQPDFAKIKNDLLTGLLETFPDNSNTISGLKKSDTANIMGDFIRNEFAGFRNEIRKMVDEINRKFLINSNISPKTEKAMQKEIEKGFKAIISKNSVCPDNATTLQIELYKKFNDFKKNFQAKATSIYNPTSPINDQYQRILQEMKKTRDVLPPVQRAEAFIDQHYNKIAAQAISEFVHNQAKEFAQDNTAQKTLSEAQDDVNASFAVYFRGLSNLEDNDPKKQIAVDLVKQARQTVSSTVTAHYNKTHETPKAESRRGSGLFSSPSSRRGSAIISSPSPSKRNSLIPSVFKKGIAELKEVKEKEKSANSEKGQTPPSMQNSNN